MTRRVILHIGSPKTGTSAIQVFLARHRAELAAHGCCYPTNPDVERAAEGLVTSGNGLGVAKFLNPDLRHRVAGADWLDEFRSLLTELPARYDCVLYSSEFLWRARPENLRRLGEVVAVAGFGVTVIAYVRSPEAFAVSEYSQRVKRHRETRPLDEAIADLDLDIGRVLDDYSAVFGADRLRVRVFDPDQFLDGDLVADFLAQLDLRTPLTPAEIRGPIATVNPSISLQESEAMRFLNRLRLPVKVMDEVPGAYRRLRDGSGLDRLGLSEHSAGLMRARHHDEIERIEQRYLVAQTLDVRAPIAQPRRSPPPTRRFSLAVGLVAGAMAVRGVVRRRWRRWRKLAVL